MHLGNKGDSYLDLFPHLFLDCFKFNSEPKKRGRPTGEQDPCHKLVRDTWLTLEKSKFQKDEYAVFVIVFTANFNHFFSSRYDFKKPADDATNTDFKKALKDILKAKTDDQGVSIFKDAGSASTDKAITAVIQHVEEARRKTFVLNHSAYAHLSCICDNVF